MKLTFRCDGVENGGSADVIDFSVKDRQPGDVGNSSSVRAAIKLELHSPDDRGKFQAGKKYTVEFVEAPVADDAAEGNVQP